MIVSLEQFKTHMMELTTDRDASFNQALEAAHAEADQFLGIDTSTAYATTVPADIRMAVLLLAQCYAEADSPQDDTYRRTAAHRLMTPHRVDTGFGSMEAAA